MNYSFEYIDIILLAMIAGFIFLRLRGILGKKTGFEENLSTSFPHEVSPKDTTRKIDAKNFIYFVNISQNTKDLKTSQKLS